MTKHKIFAFKKSSKSHLHAGVLTSDVDRAIGPNSEPADGAAVGGRLDDGEALQRLYVEHPQLRYQESVINHSLGLG